MLPPLPLTERSLCLFAAFLPNHSLQASSIMAYLSAERQLQISVGLPSPTTDSWPWLHYVIRDIKRSRSQPQRVCLPITTSILKQLHGVSDIYGHPCYKAKLLWAVASTAFFGFFRLGELLPSSGCNLSPLLLTDLAIDSHENPSLFILSIRRAKNDPFGKGAQVILGSTLSPLCPVKALK